MSQSWLECRVTGDLINMNEIREINKPTKIRKPKESKTHEILIEFAQTNIDGDVKICPIYQGTERDCMDFFAYLKESLRIERTII